MKKFLIIAVVLAALGGGAGAYYMRRGGPEPKVDTLQVTRGDIADVVPATGTLEAVTTVDVGTQVSGIVQELYADFNSIVRKGQIIARLDPSLIQTAIEQRRASVTRAEAEIERLRVNLDDARRKLGQARQMWDKQLIPRDQLETAEMTVKTIEVQIKSAEASLVQAKADLNQQTVNLKHTVIESPIDGIVISRNVDPGQTVAASMSAPTLYVIAADLTKMQVITNIDEADVGRMRPGQPVSFRVDAYPNDIFYGSVEQVRLQPTTVQNVVTYPTVISVPNPDLKLKPGMTANVTVEVARVTNVLRVPAAALRFRPNADQFTALRLPVPPEIANRGAASARSRGGLAGPEEAAAGASPAAATAGTNASQNRSPVQSQGAQPQERSASSTSMRTRGLSRPGVGSRQGDGAASERAAAGGGRERGGFDPNMSPEDRRRRLEERLAAMTPEARERWQARMRERGSRDQGPDRMNPDINGRGAESQGERWDASRGITQRASGGSSIASGATTIDALFAPLVIPERSGVVWLWSGGQLKRVRIRYSVSDGTWFELVDGGIEEGQELVTNVTTGFEERPTAGQGGQQNPLMGPQRGRGFGRGR